MITLGLPWIFGVLWVLADFAVLNWMEEFSQSVDMIMDLLCWKIVKEGIVTET